MAAKYGKPYREMVEGFENAVNRGDYVGPVKCRHCTKVVLDQQATKNHWCEGCHLTTKTWDKVWGGLYAPVFLSTYVVAGLDAVRYGWSSMPGWLWLIGLAIFLPGTAVFSWSMGVNPFFEKTVRIQTERGHQVIDTGPYRFVRHPGYLGFLGWILSAPFLLGSWWAFVPSVLSVAGLVGRTALEDRTLREELAGYAEYATRVRFRLIPGVW